LYSSTAAPDTVAKDSLKRGLRNMFAAPALTLSIERPISVMTSSPA
jgi:hypothetical protein